VRRPQVVVHESLENLSRAVHSPGQQVRQQSSRTETAIVNPQIKRKAPRMNGTKKFLIGLVAVAAMPAFADTKIATTSSSENRLEALFRADLQYRSETQSDAVVVAPTARRRCAPNPVFAGSTVPFGVLSVVTDRLKNLSFCTSSALALFCLG
jgi:hypothetical protein